MASPPRDVFAVFCVRMSFRSRVHLVFDVRISETRGAGSRRADARSVNRLTEAMALHARYTAPAPDRQPGRRSAQVSAQG